MLAFKIARKQNYEVTDDDVQFAKHSILNFLLTKYKYMQKAQ